MVVIALMVSLLQGSARHKPSSQVFKAGMAEELACRVKMAANPGTLRHALAAGLPETPRIAFWHVLDGLTVSNGAACERNCLR